LTEPSSQGEKKKEKIEPFSDKIVFLEEGNYKIPKGGSTMNNYSSVLGQIIGLFPKAEFYKVSKKSGAEMSAKRFSFTYRDLWEWLDRFFSNINHQTRNLSAEPFLRTNWTV